MNAKSGNDPEIARRESDAARRERGYLKAESGQERYSVVRDGSTVESGLDLIDAQDLRDSLTEHSPDVDCQIVNDTSAPAIVPRLDMTKMLCQEASQFSTTRYLACSQPATKLVLSERGRRLYPMCDMCADHNIRNRGAKLAAVHEAINT